MKPRFNGAAAILLALALAVALIGAGCGGREGTSAKPSPTKASSTAPVTPSRPTQARGSTSTPDDTPQGTGWTTKPLAARSQVTAPPVPSLVGIRTGAHGGYDRIVFDFEGKTPGYDLRYVAKVIQDPFGEPADLPGRRFLLIRFEPTDAHNAAGNPTVPRTVKRLDLPMMRAYQIVGDFEAVTSIAIGLDDTVAYRLGVLSDPSRIYVDVAA